MCFARAFALFETMELKNHHLAVGSSKTEAQNRLIFGWDFVREFHGEWVVETIKNVLIVNLL
jgi:hypothetical protein